MTARVVVKVEGESEPLAFIFHGNRRLTKERAIGLAKQQCRLRGKKYIDCEVILYERKF